MLPLRTMAAHNSESQLSPKPIHPVQVEQSLAVGLQRRQGNLLIRSEEMKLPVALSIPCSVESLLVQAAAEIQRYLQQQDGLCYDVTEIDRALVEWLENSIEQLAQDAVWHCCSGHQRDAFNRHCFGHALARLSQQKLVKGQLNQPN